jgi:hypothetical protein
MDDDAPTRRLFSPEGFLVESVMSLCITACPIDYESAGPIADDDLTLGSFSDFPNFESYNTSDNRQIVVDHEGTEFLAHHCRWVLCDPTILDGEKDRIDAWDPDIVTACVRLVRLYDGVRQLKNLEVLLPKDWLDTTCNAVLDNVLVGRMEGEIAGLNAKVDAYRATRTEIEHIDEMPCGTCDGKGGELLPCNECGYVQCADDDPDAEQLDKAEQRMASQ